MQIEVRRADPATTRCDALVIPLTRSKRLPRTLRALERAAGSPIARHREAGLWKGERRELLALLGEGSQAKHLLLVGLGEEREVDAEAVREALGLAAQRAAKLGSASVAVCSPSLRRPLPRELAQAIAEGAILGSYRFGRYQTLDPKPEREIERLAILGPDAPTTTALRAGVRDGAVIAESVLFARDLANEPGSVHTPAWLADQARRMARSTGLRCRVMQPAELERAGMGGILAVGRGSANPPRLIVLEHGAPKRGDRSRRRGRIALVGKGITFDTGGISIKPAADMDLMKGDMSGGAAVIGALRAAALLKLPLHVIGIVPAAQNMPDGEAYLPGDVVTSAAGTTIEVLNTDAEGRIVLADGLHHATSFEPDAIVDVATLTGAKIIALGSHCAAVMGNDARLQKRIQEAGDRTHERVWPLPLWEEHRRQIKGSVGDLKNTGGREAGSSTAGALLSHFVGETPWAHLDIAGNEFTAREAAYCPRGATGFGVRLLVETLRSWS